MPLRSCLLGLGIAGALAVALSVPFGAFAAEAPVAATRAILDDALPNYPETRFRNVRFVSTGFTDKPDVLKGFCGELNTQNRMGGYTGWSKFFVSPDPLMAGAPDRLYVFGMKGTLDDYMTGATNRFVTTLCGIAPKPLDGQDYASRLSYSAASK